MLFEDTAEPIRVKDVFADELGNSGEIFWASGAKRNGHEVLSRHNAEAYTIEVGFDALMSFVIQWIISRKELHRPAFDFDVLGAGLVSKLCEIRVNSIE